MSGKDSVTPKQHQLNIQLLEQMTKTPPNDRCADCNDKGQLCEQRQPRICGLWAVNRVVDLVSLFIPSLFS